MRVGSRVRVERDETLYPGKGTWPQFRGRVGTVVTVNRDTGVFTVARTDKGAPRVLNYRRYPDASHNEYGVSFARNPRRSDVDAWFRPHELTVIGRVVLPTARPR